MGCGDKLEGVCLAILWVVLGVFGHKVSFNNSVAHSYKLFHGFGSLWDMDSVEPFLFSGSSFSFGIIGDGDEDWEIQAFEVPDATGVQCGEICLAGLLFDRGLHSDGDCCICLG